MIATFFDGLDVLYHHAKFGGDQTMLWTKLLYAQLSCVSFFTFDMIRFTGYIVIAEKPRVSHLTRIFQCTL